MKTIEQSETFLKWYSRLRDERLIGIVLSRINRLAEGMPGDTKSVGSGVSELRIHYGAGYRVYFTERGRDLVILLCGGDKKSQVRDIEKAKQIAEQWR